MPATRTLTILVTTVDDRADRLLDNLGVPAPPRTHIQHVLLVPARILEDEFLGRYLKTDLTARLVAAGHAEPKLIAIPTLTLHEGQINIALLAIAHIDNRHPLLIAPGDRLLTWTPYDFITRADHDQLDGIIVTATPSPTPSPTIGPAPTVELAASGLVSSVLLPPPLVPTPTPRSPMSLAALVSAGLYFWTQGRDFIRSAYDRISPTISPTTTGDCQDRDSGLAYNPLIARGGRVGVHHVDGCRPLSPAISPV